MSKYVGDFTAGDVIDFKFTTFRPSTGAPFTLAGSPVVSVYKDNSLTQSITGVTLSVNFDSVTGLHNVNITTASDGTFYANGGEFECVITTGTVDSVSLVGACIGRFTLGATAANVYNALLANYTLANSFGQRLLRSTTSQSSCAVTGSSHIAADIHELQPAVISAADFADSALVIAGASGTGVKAYLATDSITANVLANDSIDAAAITADATAEIADRVLGRTISGGADGGRTVTSALRILRNKFTAASTTLTVYAEDDLTTAWTSTLSTDAAATPITGSDPA